MILQYVLSDNLNVNSESVLFKDLAIINFFLHIKPCNFAFAAFKLVQVDMYRQRLKERQRRKRIARSYGLMLNMSAATANNKKQKDSQSKKKVNRDEK